MSRHCDMATFLVRFSLGHDAQWDMCRITVLIHHFSILFTNWYDTYLYIHQVYIIARCLLVHYISVPCCPKSLQWSYPWQVRIDPAMAHVPLTEAPASKRSHQSKEADVPFEDLAEGTYHIDNNICRTILSVFLEGSFLLLHIICIVRCVWTLALGS